MTNIERLIIIIIMMAVTMMTRFAVLVIKKRNPSETSKQLMDALPFASIGLLMVYGLQDTILLKSGSLLYEILSLLLITIVFIKTKHSLLSLAIGLSVYLMLVNLL